MKPTIVVCTLFVLAGSAAAGASAAPGNVAPSATDEVAAAVPLPLIVEPRVPIANGRPVAFEVRVPADEPPLASLAAKLGGRQAVTAPWSENGRQFLVLASVDIDTRQWELDLELSGTREDGTPFVSVRRLTVEEVPYDERQITVSGRYVNAPRWAQRRAAREAEDLRAVLAAPDAERHWRGSFMRPTDTEETSPFGTLRTYNKRKRQNRHLGWDLDGVVGDPIRATARGRVALVQDRYYSGGTVVIDHGQGLFSMYFHMSSFAVKPGQTVEQGQLIGAVGKSGRVTGPHLHFSVKLDGLYLDPKALLAIDLDDDPLIRGPRVDRTASAVEPATALGP